VDLSKGMLNFFIYLYISFADYIFYLTSSRAAIIWFTKTSSVLLKFQAASTISTIDLISDIGSSD